MQVIVKTRKLGGSIITTIPSDAVKAMSIKPNETLELDIKKHRRSFFGIAKGMREFTEEDRFDRH